MTRLLPLVLCPRDLPLAELCATRLDGESYTVDDGYAPSDEIERPAVRATALACELPKSLIVVGVSALWVYGARITLPRKHTLAIDHAHRVRPPKSPRFQVRETVFYPNDVVTIAGTRIASPVRTLVDVLRLSPSFGAARRETFLRAMATTRLTSAELSAWLVAHPSMQHSIRARERLAFLERLKP